MEIKKIKVVIYKDQHFAAKFWFKEGFIEAGGTASPPSGFPIELWDDENGVDIMNFVGAILLAAIDKSETLSNWFSMVGDGCPVLSYSCKQLLEVIENEGLNDAIFEIYENKID
ncbi:MAG: hypothetical protein CUN55_17485, partial [Phototrophicales bacterium]